jgi:ATP-binding cassette subfamily B protein
MVRAFRQLWPYLWRHRRGLGIGFGALIIKDLLVILQPLLIREGVDRLATGFSLVTVLLFCGILVGVSAFKGMFQYSMRVRLVGISRDIENDLRNDLYGHLVQLAPEFFHKYRTGDLLSRSTSDLNAVRMMLGPGIMYWFETMLTFVLAVVVMMSVDWRLTLIALGPAPLVSVVVMYFGRKIHTRFERMQTQFGAISGRVQENLSGVRMVRAYRQEAHEVEMFDELNKEYMEETLRLARTSALFMPLLQFLVGTTFLLVLWAGGLAVVEGRITLGSFVMFNTIMGMLVWPMIAFGWVVNLMQRGSASFSRIRDLLTEKPTIQAPAKPVALAEPVRGEVSFEGVTLRYGLVAAAVENVTLRIAAGETVAIVGHTGSGKTSLAQMVPRMMDPTAGVVRVDGVDVREMDPGALRSVIGFVPQESFLFSSTIAENIALGAPGATREQVQQAAELAGLGPDLEGFPLGLDTVVGERGITLSGGQKQRTAIARAIARDPRILILDDSLSSVDTATEERILAGLAGVRSGRTTILISHRVSTVRQANRIYVMDHGRVIEEGTHEELLGRGGVYAELHQKQLIEEELEAI